MVVGWSCECSWVYIRNPAIGKESSAATLPRGHRCAVVSNSGVMLNHHYGQEIDDSDLVFRFNDAKARLGKLAL
eukprot:6244681-Amphidinium_carterae.1